MSEELEGYITVPEAAEKLRRSSEQVRRYLREGKLEGRRIGGQWFIQEVGVLYETKRPEEGLEMGTANLVQKTVYEADFNKAHGALFARIASRRERIQQRWQSLGLSVDAVELVHATRDEEA